MSGLLAVAALIVASAIAILLGAAVIATAPGRTANRRLALVLTLEGAMLAAMAVHSALYDGGAAAQPRWMEALLSGVVLAVTAAYLVLLSSLETPIVRAFRHPRTQTAIAGYVALLSLGGYVYGTPAGDGSGGEMGAIIGILSLVTIVGVAVFGIVATVSAYRRTTPGTRTRSQAAAFLAAFATRDACWGAMVIFGLTMPEAIANLFWSLGPAVAALLYLPILAYGLLRTQLFDIDLKIKVGIRRSTVVTIMLLVALAAAKTAEFYLNRTYGWIAGGVAAGAMLVLAPRLNKMGEKVASSAMPKVENTSKYVEFRKMEVYRAAIESALEEGDITDKERRTLGRLRAKLGISEDDASALEADLLAAAKGSVPAVTPAAT